MAPEDAIATEVRPPLFATQENHPCHPSFIHIDVETFHPHYGQLSSWVIHFLFWHAIRVESVRTSLEHFRNPTVYSIKAYVHDTG